MIEKQKTQFFANFYKKVPEIMIIISSEPFLCEMIGNDRGYPVNQFQALKKLIGSRGKIF